MSVEGELMNRTLKLGFLGNVVLVLLGAGLIAYGVAWIVVRAFIPDLGAL